MFLFKDMDQELGVHLSAFPKGREGEQGTVTTPTLGFEFPSVSPPAPHVNDADTELIPWLLIFSLEHF